LRVVALSGAVVSNHRSASSRTEVRATCCSIHMPRSLSASIEVMKRSASTRRRNDFRRWAP
jgi:hypothetical protein